MDLEGARKAGYSDAEIASFLAPNVGFDLDSAHRSGYSDTEIVDGLTASPKVTDYLKSAAAGALSGAGMIFQGGGELLARGVNAVAPSAELRAVNPLQGAIDWLEESKSTGAKRAEATSQVAGSLFEPDTWSFGSNPTMSGLALQGVNAIGQFAPNLAVALGTMGASVPVQLTIGATVGGLQALGGGAEEERTKFSTMGHNELVASSELYRTLIANGVEHDVARNAVAEAAALGGGLGNAIPSAAEGAFENFLIGALLKGKVRIPAAFGKGIAGRAVTGIAGGAAMGGTEEAIEQVGQNIGSNIAIGGNRPLTADTLQQFVMGALAEGVFGGAGGAFSRPAVNAPDIAEQERFRENVAALERAPNVDTAVQAASAAVEAPVAETRTNVTDLSTVVPNVGTVGEAIAAASEVVDTPLINPEREAAFARAEQEAQVKRQADEEAAYAQREGRIAELNRQIEAFYQTEKQRNAAGKAAAAQEPVRSAIAEAIPQAPQTAMTRAMANAAGVDADAAFAARGRDLLARMEEQKRRQDALQEQSTRAVDVLEQAGNGPGVGVENQPGQPAGAQEPTPQPAGQPNAVIQPAAAPAQPQTAYQRRSEIRPEKDSLFTAIAKLGGLNKQEVVSSWGTDPADVKRLTPLFGKPLLRVNGGLSIDGMAELLVQYGYLNQRDLREFETKFGQELRGKPVLTFQGQERQAAQIAETNAAEQAEETQAQSLDLTPDDLSQLGYDKLNESEQEQYQTILDRLVEYAQGKPYEALIDAIMERAAIQAGNRPYKEYAQAVIQQVRGVINANPNNQPAQAERGAGRQGAQENNPDLGQEGRPAAAVNQPRSAYNPNQQTLELTGQTPAEVRAAASPQALAQREAAERKAIADREREHFTLTPQAPAERVAAPEQGLFTPTGKPAEAAQNVGTSQQVPTLRNPEQRSNQPVAESQAPATSEPGERGVAPAQAAAAPERTNLPAERQQLYVERGNQRFPVASLEEASQKWGQFFHAAVRAGAGGSGGSIGGAKIVDQNGKEVARISQNGKVWPPGEWQSGMKPLVDPFAPKKVGTTPSNAQHIVQKSALQNVGTSQQVQTERPYRDTPKAELVKLAHETEDDAQLKAVEDELNLRAEEKAKTREERLTKARTIQNEKKITPEEKREKELADQRRLGLIKQETAGYSAAPIFYSELARKVEQINLTTAPASSWKDFIRGLTSKGVKAEEIEWTGINEWLDLQRGKVTKQQVLDYLAQNGVKVEEVTLGEAQPPEGIKLASDHTGYTLAGFGETGFGENPQDAALKLQEGFERQGRQWSKLGDEEKSQRFFDRASSLDDYIERVAGVGGKPNDAKFATYQLPGGKNYRELLLTLPVQSGAKAQHRSDYAAMYMVPKYGQDYLARYDDWTPQEKAEYNALPGGAMAQGGTFVDRPGAVFRSGHFDQPNILAHVRFNERTDAEGKKVLFIEEIQSDWAQKGKREGFASSAERQRIEAEILGKHGFKVDENTTVEKLEKAGVPMELRAQWWENFMAKGTIPSAPFVGKTDAWVALTLKRMIRYAAENGMDRIAWTSGDQQVSRYTSALRHAVDAIEWTKTPEGVQLVGYKGSGNAKSTAKWQELRDELHEVDREIDTVADSTSLGDADQFRGLRERRKSIEKELAKLETRTKVVDTTEKEDVLSDAIGKSMADKIKADPAQSGTIEGENIKIDDTGMAAFYDRMVPNIAKDVLKKLGGGKIESISMTPEVFAVRRPHGWVMEDADGNQVYGPGSSEASIKASWEIEGLRKQAGFDITPALREKALGGMSLFQPQSEYNPDAADHIYDNAQTRPGTTGEQRQLGIAAIKALFGGDRRAGSTILASALWRYFTEGKGADLVGLVVKSAKDLAILAQILRDPRFETFRFFFTKGDTIVDHHAMTSHLPGAVAVWQAKPGETRNAAVERQATELRRMMTATGADGYWLMHNHPSGSSWPSNNDHSITQELASLVVGFKGHVIIDHDEFSTVNERGEASRREIKSGPKPEPEQPHDLLWRRIHNEKSLSDIGRELQAKSGYDVMISTNAVGAVQAIAEVPTHLLLQGGRSIIRVRRFAKGSGGDRVFVVSQNPSRLESLVASGAVTDATDYAGHKSLGTMGIRATAEEREKTQYKPKIMAAEQETAPYVAGKTTGNFRDNYAKGASEFVRDLLHSDARVGWWAKSIGTQQHKALTLPEFKPVYDEGQAFLSDVSKFANGSADLAQDLLPRIDGFGDFLKKNPNKADIERVTDALYAGTLFGGGSPLEGKVWTDTELKQGRAIDKNGVSIQAFKPLNDNQIKLYREALAATSNSLEELGKSLIHRTVRTHDIGFNRDMSLEDAVADVQDKIDEAIGEAKLAEDLAVVKELQDTKASVADIAGKTQSLQKAGYFPAMRFGRYAIHVVEKDEKGNTKQLYFGLYESQTKANLAARELEKQYPGADIQRGIMSQEQHRLFQGLSLDALETFADYITGPTGEPIAKDPLVQGFLKAAIAERSVLKRHIHRKGIAGYSEDMPRVLASFTTAAARHTAMNYHGAEMAKLAQDIKAGDVKDEAIKLVRYLQDPMEEAQALRGFLFMQFLGGSIANGLVNMTQPFMVTGPYLTQYTSASDAAIQIMKATRPGTLTKTEQNAVDRAHKEGVTSPQEIHQLRAQTGGLPLAKNLALRKISYLWGSIYSLTEQFNRKTTFLAAYRIAEKKKIADAYGFAKKAVEETQFVYNKGNRPNWARGPVGATLFTFKQFSISYLELMKRLYENDKKAFALMALMLLAAAGIEGLPFAEDIEDMVDTMGQWMGYATNSKKKVRQWAIALVGPELAQVALRGVSGLPWMPVDVSARMGMANLIPGTAMLKQSEKNKARDVIELAGPAGQFIPTEDTMLGRALERIAKGDIGGAVKAGAPRAVQAVAKGYEQLQTGQARDVKGKKITNVTPGEAIFQMAGLNPAGVARESQKIGIVQQDIDLHNRMESEISEQWARGIVDGERDQVRKAREKLLEWNKDNPELRIAINGNQIIQRIKELRTSREERFVRHAPKEIRREVGAALR